MAPQRGNGVVDSLPLRSGNLDAQPGRQRLPLAHPLQPLEPVEHTIDFTTFDKLAPTQSFRSEAADFGRKISVDPKENTRQN
jgi:hypothetical protein